MQHSDYSKFVPLHTVLTMMNLPFCRDGKTTDVDSEYHSAALEAKRPLRIYGCSIAIQDTPAPIN